MAKDKFSTLQLLLLSCEQTSLKNLVSALPQLILLNIKITIKVKVEP